MEDSTTYNFRKRYNIYTNKTVLSIIMNNYLTERQKIVVCEILIYNKTEKEVANLLHISQPTVSRHLKSGIEVIKHYTDFLSMIINSRGTYGIQI